MHFYIKESSYPYKDSHYKAETDVCWLVWVVLIVITVYETC